MSLGGITFTWPFALLGLLLAPISVGLYVWWLRRRRRYAIEYSNLELVRSAMPARAAWKRHVPFALLIAGITGLAIGAARPQTEVRVPLSQTTIMLALDTSTSMCATGA